METKRDKVPFQKVRIALENQEEVDQMFAVLNYILIKRALVHFNREWDDLYEVLLQHKSEGYNKVHEKLDYFLNK